MKYPGDTAERRLAAKRDFDCAVCDGQVHEHMAMDENHHPMCITHEEYTEYFLVDRLKS